MVETAEKDQKTEEPTGKRLEEAREEGQLPISRELGTWGLFVGALIVFNWFGPLLGRKMFTSLQVFLEKPDQISLEDGGMQNLLLGTISSIALPITLVFGTLFVAAILATGVQTDFYLNPSRVKLDFAKLNPMRGLMNIFSLNAITELVKSFFKLVVLGYVTYRVLLPVVDTLPSLIARSLESTLAFLHDQAIHLMLVLMVIISVIAIADWLYVRFQYFKNLRMTKQEVKDEHKQMEGDPMVKGRLRQIRLDKARRRMMAQVPRADVVITNPTHYAVALQYDNKKMAAPVVLAKGTDKVAMRIREVAEEYQIPLVSNPPLSRALYDTVELDEAIQPEHYRAVAEVISYVYKLKKKIIRKDT